MMLSGGADMCSRGSQRAAGDLLQLIGMLPRASQPAHSKYHNIMTFRFLIWSRYQRSPGLNTNKDALRCGGKLKDMFAHRWEYSSLSLVQQILLFIQISKFPIIMREAFIKKGLSIVKLRANSEKSKVKLGPEIGFVMAWSTTHHHHITFFEL